MKTRCAWPGKNQLMQTYHDVEWGVPLHDDQKLFEFLVLDAFQAGLSWSTILNKRENFRIAFDDFDPLKIVEYDESKTQSLLGDAGIIRNKLKIHSTISNARLFLEAQTEFDTFDNYIWQFVGGKPIINQWKTLEKIPVSTRESDAMSEDLKQRGFKFVGTTICYAFMQAAGMVNDHTTDCFRYREINKLK